MSPTEPPNEAVAEIRQLNRLFLDFLRDQGPGSVERFGLSARAAEILSRADQQQIERAAGFPRALFGLGLAPVSAAAVPDLAATSNREQVVALVLLHSARNLARMSGYWARLLLRLNDDSVQQLRAATVEQIVALSAADGVVTAAFGVLDRVLPELLEEPHPERWRRLLLLGFQPDILSSASADTA